jgi:class 3 adenylate cyclase
LTGAAPSTLLVDRATRDALPQTAFACGSEHAAELKGFDNRVPLYDVTRSG